MTQPTSQEGSPVRREGFSFFTPEGAEAVANLARLANREVTLEELNDDRYGIEPGGTLRLDVDAETFDLLSGNKPKSS